MIAQARSIVIVALSLSLPIFATARAGIDETVQAIVNSDIRFTLAESYVPFIPVAWANYRHYAATEFVSGPDPGEFRERQSNVGAIVRFARKAMGLKQVVLAALLDVTASTVSKWETGTDPVSKTTQLAVLALVDLSIGGADLRLIPESTDKDKPLEVPHRAA